MTHKHGPPNHLKQILDAVDYMTGPGSLVEGAARLQRRIAGATTTKLARGLGWAHKFEPRMEKVGRFLVEELRWPPLANLSSRSLIKVMKRYHAGEASRHEIVSALVRIHDEEALEAMYARWQGRSWFDHRLPILRAALDAHLRGDYLLSIPATLPQIEGVVFEAAGFEGYGGKRDLSQQLESVLGSKKAGYKGWLRSFYEDRLRESFRWGGEDRELSRNAILHGMDTSYGEESKSLRVLLTFDYVQQCLEYASPEGDPTFHRMDCAQLQRSTGLRRLFPSYPVAADELTAADCVGR